MRASGKHGFSRRWTVLVGFLMVWGWAVVLTGAEENSAGADEAGGDDAYGQESSQLAVEEVGTIPAEMYRSIPVSDDPCQQAFLDEYDRGEEDFEYRKVLLRETPLYDVYYVSFPSAYASDVTANNTVYCEYYRQNGDGSRPSVILLGALDGDMTLPRVIAHTLATSGIDVCIMVLPYYGARQGGGVRGFAGSPDMLVEAVEQAVMDVRRSAAWLAAQEGVDADRIGLCGVSLGGLISALTAGVDGGFGRVVLVVAGGDLAYVLMTDAPEVQGVRAELQSRGISVEQFRKATEPIEPLVYADRLRNTRVLMLNATDDRIIPAHCAQALADEADAEIVWFETDHTGLANHIMRALQLTVNHFAARHW
ncbi:MAG: prolyl oligopeptidase family serine peptidase [Sedimentisphaerales bacterium]|nr:prolyl oligopeptidase family serine peptidase [Sedimentisphaerales bacterium]